MHDEQNLPSVTVTDSLTFHCPYCGGEGITAGRGSDEFAAPAGHTILLDVAGRNLIRCHWNGRNRDWWLECGNASEEAP